MKYITYTYRLYRKCPILYKSDVTTITKTAIKICGSILRLFRSSGDQLLWTGFQKSVGQLTKESPIFTKPSAILSYFNYSISVKICNRKLFFIKSLAISTSLVYTTFIRYAHIGFASTPWTLLKWNRPLCWHLRTSFRWCVQHVDRDGNLITPK